MDAGAYHHHTHGLGTHGAVYNFKVAVAGPLIETGRTFGFRCKYEWKNYEILNAASVRDRLVVWGTGSFVRIRMTNSHEKSSHVRPALVYTVCYNGNRYRPQQKSRHEMYIFINIIYSQFYESCSPASAMGVIKTRSISS